MKNQKLLALTCLTVAFLLVLSSPAWSAEQAKVNQAVKNAEILNPQKGPVPIAVVSCTCRGSISGLPKPLGNGQWNIGQTVKVNNPTSGNVSFTATGTTTYVINGQNKTFNCSAAAGQPNSVNANANVTVNMNCGSFSSDNMPAGKGDTANLKVGTKTIICKLDTTPIPPPK